MRHLLFWGTLLGGCMLTVWAMIGNGSSELRNVYISVVFAAVNLLGFVAWCFVIYSQLKG
jgi:hypothetical protein